MFPGKRIWALGVLGWALALGGFPAGLRADGKSEAIWFVKVLQDQVHHCFCPPDAMTPKQALDIVRAYVNGQGRDTMTEADICTALSKVYPCSVSLSTTVASLSDGRHGNFHSFNIETPGNLAATRDLGCIDLAAVTAMDSPVDLFNAAAACAQSGDDERAAGLVTVGTIFGKYDM
ncbi:MAG TPA: hypothetical protein VK842_03805, partial [bacterium]|nr:hypothetical protein [bacterium]